MLKDYPSLRNGILMTQVWRFLESQSPTPRFLCTLRKYSYWLLPSAVASLENLQPLRFHLLSHKSPFLKYTTRWYNRIILPLLNSIVKTKQAKKTEREALHLATLWYDEAYRERGVPWRRNSFLKFAVVWRKHKSRWRSYWVFLSKPFRVLSRDGGIFPSTLSARSFFCWSLRTFLITSRVAVG